MFTIADKAWVAGLAAWLGQTIAAKLGWGAFLTPELLALVAGAATYWVPNRVAK
jgi:hypothetical protein